MRPADCKPHWATVDNTTSYLAAAVQRGRRWTNRDTADPAGNSRFRESHSGPNACMTRGASRVGCPLRRLNAVNVVFGGGIAASFISLKSLYTHYSACILQRYAHMCISTLRTDRPRRLDPASVVRCRCSIRGLESVGRLLDWVAQGGQRCSSLYKGQSRLR